MEKTLPKDEELDEEIDIKYLLLLFLFLHPMASSHKIFLNWEKDKILREYDRPDEELIEKVVSCFQKKLEREVIYRYFYE